ncbi:MAG: HAT repeat-containing protein, partial [Bryobacteraceae bacterium]
MRRFLSALFAATGLCLPLLAQDLGTQAFELERKGEAAQARQLLQRAVQDSPKSVGAWRAYAEFLDQHHDPGVVESYGHLLEVLKADNAAPAQQAAVARRMAILSLEQGNRAAVEAHLATYHSLGGKDLSWNPKPRTVPQGKQTIEFPGPIRSFSRMAALSPDLRPDDLLGALARNVVTNGYQATNSSEGLEQTEYLKLIIRYLSQARELERVAGDSKIIRIEQCESAQTGELLKVLGYRMRGGCGSDVVLETVNASRAFLTIDSGFPLAGLEQSLRTNRPFVHDFKPTAVPVMYGTEYWQAARDKQSTGESVDAFLSDPSLCRLYLGLSKLDPETAEELRKAIPVQRLKAYSHVLDFYGSLFEIRDGKVAVPGGARSEKAWTELAGASPEKGTAFLEKLLAKDDGWLASYFDALTRITGPTRDYLSDPERLKRYYTAIRGRVTSPGPARPVFRANTDMILLTARLQMDPNGKPHVPGNLDVWKNLFVNHPHGKYDGKLTKSAGGWKDPDDLLEALFGLSRKAVENEPLKIYMALTDVDRLRAKPLEPATVDRLAREYHNLGSQYSLFAEVPTVSDKTILAFIDLTQTVSKVGDQNLRSDYAGMMQSLVSLWQICARQGSIAPEDADGALAEILSGFAKPRNSRDVFDAGRAGVKVLLAATKTPAGVNVQDRFMDLIAGAPKPVESDTRTQVMQDQIRIFESQRLVSLQILFELAENLESVTKGEKLNTALAAKLAARISEIQLPRSSLSSTEKNALSFGYWTE